MKTNMRTKWLAMSALSLSLIGFGLCLIAEAALHKHNQAPIWDWVAYGTLALVVFNTGLSLFGQAVVLRIAHLSEKST